MLKYKINGVKSEIYYEMVDTDTIAYTDENKDTILVNCPNHRISDGSVVRFKRNGDNGTAEKERIATYVDKDNFTVEALPPHEIKFNNIKIESIATGFDENHELVYRDAYVLELPDEEQFITMHTYDSVRTSISTDYYSNDEYDNSYKCAGDEIEFNGLVYKTDDEELDEYNRYIFPNDPNECLNYKEIDIIFFNEYLQRECVVTGGIMAVDSYGYDDNTRVMFFYDRGSEKETLLRYIMTNMDTITLTTADKRFYHEVDSVLSFITSYWNGGLLSYIERKVGDYRLTIPISSIFSNDTRLDDIQQQFIANKIDESIEEPIDFEKKRFEPVRYMYGDGTDEEMFSDNSFSGISEIVFNLHFRERYDDPDEGKEWTISDFDGWNNYFIGEDQSHNPILVPKQGVEITDADVLRYLNFTDSDVYFKKNKLKKSFIRLSFYDSPNRGTQVLQYYSTIFFDTGDAFSNYIKAKAENNDIGGSEDMDDESILYVSDEHADNKDLRLCARFRTWCNKNMAHSSDGFYAYLFPSLIEGTLPSDLYLKIEFNHAKYGRTIPFILPTYNDSENTNRILPINPTNPSESEGHYFPIHYMKINSETGEYSEVDFKRALDDMYIKVKIKYDEKNNRYVWFLPRPKMDYEENTQLVFNLFEPRLNGYEKLPSDTRYDNIPSSAIDKYKLNITLNKVENCQMNDFNFIVIKDGESICQRIIKSETGDGVCASCENEFDYTSNIAKLNFLFELSNSMNNGIATVYYHNATENKNIVLGSKNLHGRYSTEIVCDIDLPELIENDPLTDNGTLNIIVECK